MANSDLLKYMGWDYFGKVCCISVDTRQDRQIEAKVQFEKVGLSDRVEFVIVKKHPVNSEQGIYESHMACIRKGIEADAKHILIFEDDIIFDRFSPHLLQACIDFLSTDKTWNILFLGCMVKGSWKTPYPSIVKIRYQCSTHAYVLHRDFAEKIVDMKWSGTAFDDFLASFNGGQYMVYPAFAFQSDSLSDNEKCLKFDKVRRFFGGIRRIQKMNEFYYYHRTLIIALHIFIILVIAGGILL